MIRTWMLENKVAAAFILGVLVTGLYTVFIYLDTLEGDATSDDEPPTETAATAARGEHGRRRAERQPA